MFNLRLLPLHTITFLITTLLFISPTHLYAENNHKGWEKGSEYDNLYNPKERERLKGIIKKFITVTPLEGMAKGTAFLLEEAKDEDPIVVHLCPESFAKAKETGLRRGSLVKVKGSWTEIDDEDIFIASKVKKGEHFEFKVRLTSDGTPFWSFTPEELAKERASQ